MLCLKANRGGENTPAEDTEMNKHDWRDYFRRLWEVTREASGEEAACDACVHAGNDAIEKYIRESMAISHGYRLAYMGRMK